MNAELPIRSDRRAIAPLRLPDVKPCEITTRMPQLRFVKPTELFVDESYQRGLSERSVRLIRKIVAEWSWTAFKPPVCVDVDGRLDVIDGQHTAIGAVTHGGIEMLPVLVVDADSHETRASAFVRHNRDRIQVTATQLHNAMVAAGDEDAVTIAQVCERAGIVILRNPPQMAKFKPGETLAVSAINSETYCEIMQFCRDRFGPDAWPIHGRPGRWQSGSATVYGETFMGFEDAGALAIFMGRFGHLVIEDRPE